MQDLRRIFPVWRDDLFSVYTRYSVSFWVLVGFGTLGLPQTAVRDGL